MGCVTGAGLLGIGTLPVGFVTTFPVICSFCKLVSWPSSPVSCKKLQFLLLHSSPRRYAEQYFVVPYCALYSCQCVKNTTTIEAYLSSLSSFFVPSIAAMHTAASSFLANVT